MHELEDGQGEGGATPVTETSAPHFKVRKTTLKYVKSQKREFHQTEEKLKQSTETAYAKMTVPTCWQPFVPCCGTGPRDGLSGLLPSSIGQRRRPIEARGRLHELRCRERPRLPSRSTTSRSAP
eukprot:scaffold35534_cov58-Phaeocystis_antarctica.AAC.3